MATAPDRDHWLRLRAAGWSARGARLSTGLLAFLSVTGLAITAFPRGTLGEHTVVVHTLIGLAGTAPLAWFLARHVRAYWRFPLTHVKATGWAAGAMAAACTASGLVLTCDAALGARIDYAWRTVHLVTTFGLVALLVPHLGALWLRERQARAAELAALMRGHARAALLGTLALLLPVAILAAVRPVEPANEFPAGYDAAEYGDRGPFAPSLALTDTGGAFDARSLSGSESCGASGCHDEIYREWLPSAHRYASMDPGFQAIQAVMADQNGPASTRYCGGCHDPISLFSGTKNIGVEDLSGLEGYQEGISCLACHAIRETDVKGNANYVIHQPERYAWEQRDGALAGFLSKFTLRAYPEKHVETLSRRMFKTPEFCAACHKQFIDEEVNQVGWVQLQNQYDNWKASRWHHAEDPQQTIECRECHMPLTDSRDPAAGDEADFNRSAGDGKHRSHRFLGANQYVPELLDLPGAAEHVALIEQWLRGELEVPEITERWSAGPAVPLEIEAPETVAAGAPVELRVRAINNKVGHDFPTGPLDIIQAWIEVEVTDASGAVVFSSGAVDERHFVDTGTFMFKAEPVDRYGNLIDRHNLWEMVGVRFRRSMFPGAEEVAAYAFDCPGSAQQGERAPLEATASALVPEGAAGELLVRAFLRYRKFDQFLLNFAFGEDSGLTAPITTVSSAEARIRVVPAG